MDYGGRENVVQVITTIDNNWSNDQSVWATEEDYREFSSQPPSKKSKSSSQTQQNQTQDRSKTIGKMFFKTKLCCKFRAGTCPYVTNCNFAHSIEELRQPPPNWQEIVAADKSSTSNPNSPPAVEAQTPREEFQIPSVGLFVAETPRSYKGRHCKKFYTDEGCPYGDNCTFLHDEQSKNRESVAISLGPGGGYGGGGGGGVVCGGGSAVVVVASATTTATATAMIQTQANSGGNNINVVKPSNWKTRICNKWELTGYCPFGSKCHFAHGQTELHRYGGGLVEIDARDSLTIPTESKNLVSGAVGAPAKISSEVAVSASVAAVPLSDVYHIGVPSQRSSMVIQRPMLRAHQKWKGPDKISRIYGDWIDDVE